MDMVKGWLGTGRRWMVDNRGQRVDKPPLVGPTQVITGNALVAKCIALRQLVDSTGFLKMEFITGSALVASFNESRRDVFLHGSRRLHILFVTARRKNKKQNKIHYIIVILSLQSGTRPAFAIRATGHAFVDTTNTNLLK